MGWVWLATYGRFIPHVHSTMQVPDGLDMRAVVRDIQALNSFYSMVCCHAWLRDAARSVSQEASKRLSKKKEDACRNDWPRNFALNTKSLPCLTYKVMSCCFLDGSRPCFSSPL